MKMNEEVTVTLTRRQLVLLEGALSAQLRSAQRSLEHAVEQDAIERWTSMCVELRHVSGALGEAATGVPNV